MTLNLTGEKGLIDSINIPVIIVRETGTVVSFNRSAAVYFGNEISEGMNIYEIIPSVRPDRDEIKLLLENEGSVNYYSISMNINGRTNEADISVSLYESGDGIFRVYTIRDIELYSGLMKSISRFGTIVENSPAAILITDVDGNIEYLNGNFQDLTGYTLGELAGKNVSIFRSQIKRGLNSPSIRDTLKKGEKWKGELLNVSKGGEPYWVIATISPVTDGAGEVTNFISVQEDITYLKKIEEELKQSEEKLRILFETLPEGVAVTDMSGTIMQVNRAWTEIHSLGSSEEVIGRNIFDFAGDEVGKAVSSIFGDAGEIKGNDTASYEIGRGEEKVFVDIQSALMVAGGEPIGHVILAVDNTDRRRGETALRESEARNRALVDAVPDIMFRVNDEGVYLDKMLGNKISEVFPESIAVETVRYISEAVRTREIQIYEYPVTVSGREEYYESRFIAIEDDEVLIILRNVTEKQTAIMQIEEARREAELANRSKSEFLANMSHEIRTPLNSITGFIELLMRTDVDGAQREYLGIIKKSASNLLEIINDILDFSKIESGKLELNRIEFNPFTEFESVVRLFNVKAGEKGMRFFAFIDPRIPEGVISDPLRIKQVLSNLLSNAIKFTPEDGTVIIEINLSRNSGGFCLINFSVTDTGIGIPERKREQIFEAFAQADSSITRRFGGTGLGLSISSNLVRLLGSEIVLESVMGEGSKFYFTLEAEVSLESSPSDFFRNSSLRTHIVAADMEDYSFHNLRDYLSAFGCMITVSDDTGSASLVESDIVFLIEQGDEADLSIEDAGHSVSAPLVLLSDSRHGADRIQGEGTENIRIIYQPVTPYTLFRILSRTGRSAAEADNVCLDSGAPVRYRFIGRVLVGEDNSINQRLMQLLLKDYGLEVEIAGNGLSVYEKFVNGVWDLVLMDINMPAADGFETTVMIREYEKERGGHIPVVALTAKALKDDVNAINASGMDDYLAKPVEMERLEAILVRYLHGEILETVCAGAESVSDKKGDTVPYYDLKQVADELKIPVNVLQNIGRDFLEDAEAGVEELTRLAEESSCRGVQNMAHKMMGAAGNLRFGKLAALLSELEQKSSVKEKNFDCSPLISDIIKELKVLKDYFWSVYD